MTWATRDRLWSIPAGIAALLCLVLLLPALAFVYMVSMGYSKLTGEML